MDEEDREHYRAFCLKLGELLTSTQGVGIETICTALWMTQIRIMKDLLSMDYERFHYFMVDAVVQAEDLWKE